MSKIRNFGLVLVFTTAFLVAVDSNTPSPPQRITKLEGESVDLKCSDIDAVKSRQWYFNTVDIRKFNPFAYRSLLSREGNIETLHIQDLKPSDTGVIQCRTVSPSGSSATVSYYLVIEYPAKVTFTTETTFFNVNYPTHLQCPVDAEPPVKFISWTRNGSMFDPTLLSVDTEYFPEDGMIWFHKPKASDAGVYTCIPYNVHGSAGASKGMWLVVKERFSTVAPKIDIMKAQDVDENIASEYIEIKNSPVSDESNSYSDDTTSFDSTDDSASSISVKDSTTSTPSDESGTSTDSSEIVLTSTELIITNSDNNSSDPTPNFMKTDSDPTTLGENETITENISLETTSISQITEVASYSEQDHELFSFVQTDETFTSEKTFTESSSVKSISVSSSEQTDMSTSSEITDETTDSQEADTTNSSEITDITTNSEKADTTLDSQSTNDVTVSDKTDGTSGSQQTETAYSTEQTDITENSQQTDTTIHSQRTDESTRSENMDETTSSQQTETTYGSEIPKIITNSQQTDTTVNSRQTYDALSSDKTDPTLSSDKTDPTFSSDKTETTFSSDSPLVSSSIPSHETTIISSEPTTFSDIISSTESIEIDESENNSYSGTKFIVSITLLLIAILSSIVLAFYIIKTKRRIIAYDELRLLP